MKQALACLVVASALSYAPADAQENLPVLTDLNLHHLYGHYWEVGTYLQWIESGCRNSAVSFTQNPPPSIAKVTIECDRGDNHQAVRGAAVPVDPNVLARTTVTFKGPLGREIKEEFDIIMAGEPTVVSSPGAALQGYPWLVIGHPTRRLLWIISRQPSLPTETLVDILTRLENDFGYINVRKNLTCTEQKTGSQRNCTDALQELTAVDEAWPS